MNDYYVSKQNCHESPRFLIALAIFFYLLVSLGPVQHPAKCQQRDHGRTLDSHSKVADVFIMTLSRDHNRINTIKFKIAKTQYYSVKSQQHTGKYGMMTSFITETTVPARVIMTPANNIKQYFMQ